jgi:hypothetical protein
MLGSSGVSNCSGIHAWSIWVRFRVAGLLANRWRIVHQEVTWTASGIVRVRDLSDLSTTSALPASRSAIVPQEPLVVGSASLPAHFARTAAEVAVARIAVAALEEIAPSASDQGEGEGHP